MSTLGWDVFGWTACPAGRACPRAPLARRQEPPGREWVHELDPTRPDQTDVSLTYDWAKVTDRQVLKKISFPLVGKDELEGSLSKLAAAVSG